MPVEVTEPHHLRRLRRLERRARPRRLDPADRLDRADASTDPTERTTVGVVLGSLRAGVAERFEASSKVTDKAAWLFLLTVQQIILQER